MHQAGAPALKTLADWFCFLGIQFHTLVNAYLGPCFADSVRLALEVLGASSTQVQIKPITG